jgi:hypothetical protein
MIRAPRHALLIFCFAAWFVPVVRSSDMGDDAQQSPLDVYEWSVWVGSPSQATLNAPKAYRNAMPTAVGTSRPKSEGPASEGKFPVAPISVVQFFGDPCRDVDVDLRVKKGTMLAHWPPASERGGRLQWFKADFSKAPPADVPAGYLAETHWFQKLRKADSALYLKRGSSAERFLAYDAELAQSLPVKIRGGPDEYTLQNLTPYRLLDVAVIAPTDDGYRVGWLDELAAATPEPVADKNKKDDKTKDKEKPDAEKAKAILDEAEATAGEKSNDAPLPMPAEGDPTVKARVDQVLNRPVNVNAEQAPRKELLALVAGQARFRYEVDEPTLTKAGVDLGGTMDLKGTGLAARDALAEILGTVGLSYRVAEDGSLFITTAARLAEEAGKKGAAIEGPPVKLTLSQQLKAADPSYRELTRDSYARRLAGRGLREDVANTLLDQYGDALFRPDGLIVLAHYSRDALDEIAPLDVFPEPRKLVRVAVVVAHGVDPRLQDRTRELVRKLGDHSPKARDQAEARLTELGAVAVPALEDALRDTDLEIVFRAERLLLKLNRAVP